MKSVVDFKYVVKNMLRILIIWVIHVLIHKFATKSHLDRANGPAAMKYMPDFDPATKFKGDFVHQIYHPSLTVTPEKVTLIKSVNIRSGSTYSIPNVEMPVYSYARDQSGSQMSFPPSPVLPAPLQTNEFVIQRRLRSIGENGR